MSGQPDTAEHVENIEMLNARAVCLDILIHVLDKKQPLDHVLDDHGVYLKMPARDKAFARMLIATTLRRLGQIDDLISRLQDRPDQSTMMPKVRHILRLGLCQMFFMNVPDHAAVDTAVKMAEMNNIERAKGFINAILREAQRSGRVYVDKQDAARMNTPEWLLKTWIADYDLKTAAQIATANMAEASVDITVKDEDSRNFWSAELHASSFPTGSLRLPSGSGAVQNLSGFDDGMWWVQDAAASIPVLLLGDVHDRHVVDMCAAPGGKTAQLAARGAHVVAIDRSAARLKRLHANMQRLRLEDHVETVTTDASMWRPKHAPDMILLDAPCSATGTIRRHPDILHLKAPRDIDRLRDTQARLLDHAFDILAPGGTIVYCTCSIQKDEGERQISAFLQRCRAAVKVPVQPDEIGDMSELITQDGDVRILPYHRASSGGMDGFFISRIIKPA